MSISNPALQDQPPASDDLTDYDLGHLKLYMRLLDADATGADWREAAVILFGIDTAAESDRAQRVFASHLARAKWMTEHGYRRLLAQ